LAPCPATPAAKLVGAAALGIDLTSRRSSGARRPAGSRNACAIRRATRSVGRAPRARSRARRTWAPANAWFVWTGSGRKVDYELTAALRGADALVLDLCHNHGGVLRRMLRIAGRFTGPVPGAVRLVKPGQVHVLAIPQPSGAVWRGRITVLVGADTISSGEVLAALLRRHASATVLGERTWGKDYVRSAAIGTQFCQDRSELAAQ
jgi:hypothetical protein